jgi:hypothetical protein
MVDRTISIGEAPTITINDDAILPPNPVSIYGRFFDGAVSGFVSGAIL